MNYFYSLFKYAVFSNNFSLFSKTVPKNFPQEALGGSFLIRPKTLQQVAGDRQTGHHDAHHAHQLDEDVQRRT